MLAVPVLLLRKGRVLTPRSRLRYRLKRLTTGRTGGLDMDEVVAIASLALRVVSLPALTAFDYLAWPVVSRTFGRGSWWVVELRWHGPDAELVRVAEASSADEARASLKAIARTHAPDGGPL